ncbi:O-antigen ligase family protein [Olleya sp. Ti.3.14]|uniref:O-antigen ligase family protein n=1 Tax=Olleya sp. Ti.3.14 TaxID=3121297 RepID=UPI00311F3964
MISEKIKYIKRPENLLFLLVFFPVLPFGVSTILVILFVVASLIFNYKNINENYNNGALIPFLKHTIFVLVLIFSLIYSSNFSKGIEEIRKILPLILLPFVFFFCYKNQIKKKIPVILNTFVFANLIYIIYLYNFIVLKLSPYKEFGFRNEIYPVKFVKSFFIPFNKILLKAIHVQYQPPSLMFHKAYMSMFVLFSIFILVYQFSKTKKKMFKLVSVLLIFLFLVVLIHWFSMPNIFVLGLMSVLFVFKFLNKKIIFIGALVVSGILLIASPFIKSKLNSNSIFNVNYNQVTQFIKNTFSDSDKDLSGRAAINKCSIKLVKDSPLLGYGLGAANDVLLDCYEDSNFTSELKGKLNSHNNYFHLYLSGGILALLAFIYLIINGISVSKNSFLYLSFLVVIVVNMGFENILYRSHGILFFSIFNTMLYFFVKEENQNNYKWN